MASWMKGWERLCCGLVTKPKIGKCQQNITGLHRKYENKTLSKSKINNYIYTYTHREGGRQREKERESQSLVYLLHSLLNPPNLQDILTRIFLLPQVKMKAQYHKMF